MFGHIRHVVRVAPVLVLATAVLAPTAGAGRYSLAAPPQAAATQVMRPAATCHQYCSAAVQTRGSQAPATRSLVRTELVPSSGAFRWADAAIGFAVGCGGILLVFLIVGAGRRTRSRRVGSAS